MIVPPVGSFVLMSIPAIFMANEWLLPWDHPCMRSRPAVQKIKILHIRKSVAIINSKETVDEMQRR
jgi:hypothetical protein